MGWSIDVKQQQQQQQQQQKQQQQHLFNALCPGLPVNQYQKGKPIWIYWSKRQ